MRLYKVGDVVHFVNEYCIVTEVNSNNFTPSTYTIKNRKGQEYGAVKPHMLCVARISAEQDAEILEELERMLDDGYIPGTPKIDPEYNKFKENNSEIKTHKDGETTDLHNDCEVVNRVAGGVSYLYCKDHKIEVIKAPKIKGFWD